MMNRNDIAVALMFACVGAVLCMYVRVPPREGSPDTHLHDRVDAIEEEMDRMMRFNYQLHVEFLEAQDDKYDPAPMDDQ